jgi:cytoskeletal protein CcmA (bactofilin family)
MSFFGNRRQQAEPLSAPTPEGVGQPRPVTPQQPVGFETVLGANCTMEGALRSNANVRLDGTFTGKLEITGNVLVGETAKINADIHAKNVSIAGAVRGNVSGKKVQLLRTGRIWGDISAAALTTEEGAFIDGKITMVSNDPSRPESSSFEATLVLDDTPMIDESAPERQTQGDAAESRGKRRQSVPEETDMTGADGISSEPADDLAPDEQV